MGSSTRHSRGSFTLKQKFSRSLPVSSMTLDSNSHDALLQSAITVHPEEKLGAGPCWSWRQVRETLLFYSFSSLAILDAMFLKAMDVPEIRLKRTPLSERRGSLHTSISHWTRLSACPSPWTQSSRKRSRCS